MQIQYTQEISPDSPEGLEVWGEEEYMYKHTAAFLNSDMASKAEQKTSVNST